MIYLDTSFLTPLFRDEDSTEQVSEFLARQEAGNLMVSQWVELEFASLTSRDVRVGDLTAEQGHRTLKAFESLLATSLTSVAPAARDFALACEYVANFSTYLRGPDALHLAVARNHGVEFVATLDAGMLAAATKLKLPARRVIS